MHFAYHILLLIICFGILVHCQGGRGGGRGGGGGSRGVGGIYRANSKSCDTHECRLEDAMRGVGFVLGFFVGWCVLAIPIWLCICCCKRFKSRPLQNETFVDLALTKIDRQEANPFQSGIWLSRYFQYGRWHGPHLFPLLFNSQRMKVRGSGSDDVGVFIINGIYSTETNRIGLTKIYKKGTGNSEENLGHQVTIQLTWNTQNSQFEGQWYVKTDKHKDNGEFKLQFHKESIAIESDRNGTFNVDSSYPESLNGYVTHEEYLYLLSKINPQLKQLKKYKRLQVACLIPCIFLFIVVLPLGIFWRIYVDAPGFTYIMVEFIVPSILTKTISSYFNSKIEKVRQKLQSAVIIFSNQRIANPAINCSKWTLESNDVSKCILCVELSPSCQEDVINTVVTTMFSTPQLEMDHFPSQV